MDLVSKNDGRIARNRDPHYGTDLNRRRVLI